MTAGTTEGGSRPSDGDEIASRQPRGYGEGKARPGVDQLVALLYRDLHRIAHRHLRRERRGHTLNTTALINEAYVRLAALDHVVWRDRAHVLSIAARAMRRVLVDPAVARRTQKRGGARQRLSLDAVAIEVESRIEEVIAVDRALMRLDARNARLVRVVECRFSAGMSVDETPAALALSPATVKRDWHLARAWLKHAVFTSMRSHGWACCRMSRLPPRR